MAGAHRQLRFLMIVVLGVESLEETLAGAQAVAMAGAMAMARAIRGANHPAAANRAARAGIQHLMK